MEVVKRKNIGTEDKDFILIDQEKKFMIRRIEENIEFSLYEKKNYFQQSDFLITKENYAIYSAFDELYHDIRECHIFGKNSQDEKEQRKDWLLLGKRKNSLEPIYQDGVIDYHSDGEPYYECNHMEIRPIEDGYRIRMTRNPSSLSCSVLVRKENSRYDPYNLVFARMYERLQNYDPKYHQIHMEELPYCKVKKR